MAGVNQGAIKKVAAVDVYTDLQSASTALVADTSTSLATILGTAVSASARGAVINCSSTLHYSPTGAATTGKAILPTAYTINGSKTILDAVRFIGASTETPVVNVVIFGG